MFAERLIEEKKRLGLTTKAIAEMSKMGLSDETVSRVLAKKTSDPGVCTVLDIGFTLGMQPYEIFMDAVMVAEFKAFLELKSKSEESEAERVKLVAENETLKSTNISLSREIEQLKSELEQKKEIIALHDFYCKRNQQ